MRPILTIFCAAGLLCGCARDATTDRSVSDATTGRTVSYVYDDWLYHHYDWYDDDFWVWVDDHPDCCNDRDDIEEALQNWYDDLEPSQQQAVRDRVQSWMDDQGVVPAAGQSAKDLIVETASERWTALTPAERQQWLDQRSARIAQRRASGSAAGLTSDRQAALSERASSLDPEQRAALRESAQGMSFERASSRDLRSSGAQRSISRHPTPSRAGLSGGSHFRAARGSGRSGGRRGR